VGKFRECASARWVSQPYSAYILKLPMGPDTLFHGQCSFCVIREGIPSGRSYLGEHLLTSCPNSGSCGRRRLLTFTMNKAERSKQLPAYRLNADAWHNKGPVHWTNVLAFFAGPLWEEVWPHGPALAERVSRGFPPSWRKRHCPLCAANHPGVSWRLDGLGLPLAVFSLRGILSQGPGEFNPSCRFVGCPPRGFVSPVFGLEPPLLYKQLGSLA